MPICQRCGREFRGSGTVCPICQQQQPAAGEAAGDRAAPAATAAVGEESSSASPETQPATDLPQLPVTPPGTRPGKRGLSVAGAALLVIGALVIGALVGWWASGGLNRGADDSAATSAGSAPVSKADEAAPEAEPPAEQDETVPSADQQASANGEGSSSALPAPTTQGGYCDEVAIRFNVVDASAGRAGIRGELALGGQRSTQQVESTERRDTTSGKLLAGDPPSILKFTYGGYQFKAVCSADLRQEWDGQRLVKPVTNEYAITVFISVFDQHRVVADLLVNSNYLKSSPDAWDVLSYPLLRYYDDQGHSTQPLRDEAVEKEGSGERVVFTSADDPSCTVMTMRWDGRIEELRVEGQTYFAPTGSLRIEY